ncbi:MAG: hypothetical protein HYY09_07035 [Firmicutes bacterium]|nr:hypothetical protein [Bacillota bacterium]
MVQVIRWTKNILALIGLFTVMLIIGVAIVGISLPKLVAPRANILAGGSDLTLEVSQEAVKSFESKIQGLGDQIQKSPGSPVKLEITDEELNSLLAQNILRNPDTAETISGMRLNIREGGLDGAVNATIAGREVGLSFSADAAVVDDQLAINFKELKAGRIPVPISFLMGFLPGEQGDSPFVLDKETGSLRFPLKAEPGTEGGIPLKSLTLKDGMAVIELDAASMIGMGQEGPDGPGGPGGPGSGPGPGPGPSR